MDMSMDLFMSLLFPNVGHSGFGGRSIQAKPQQRLAWGVICKKKKKKKKKSEGLREDLNALCCCCTWLRCMSMDDADVLPTRLLRCFLLVTSTWVPS